MRELTVRIRFTRHSLGNVPARDKSGRFLLPRSPTGQVIFLASWHLCNLRYAAQVLGRHQDEVKKISWDIVVDAALKGDRWFRRYYMNSTQKRRHVLHEAIKADQVVGINCVVPPVISHDDLWQLMQIAGRYKGLSPFRPTEYGLFEVESIRPRRGQPRTAEEPEDVTEGIEKKTPDAVATHQVSGEGGGQSFRCAAVDPLT